jgi:hypothetical protein
MFLRGRGVLGFIFASAMLVLPVSQAGGQVRSDQWNSLSAKQLESGIEKEHPAAYFILAQKLYGEGRRDDATMWFYIGQIRYRAYLITNPNLNPSGDPAVFSSLFNTIGPVINGYAFGDIPQLLKIIDRALDWDAKNPDAFTPKSAKRDEVRAGLAKLKLQIAAQQDEIRAQRKKNGLENRN